MLSQSEEAVHEGRDSKGSEPASAKLPLTSKRLSATDQSYGDKITPRQGKITKPHTGQGQALVIQATSPSHSISVNSATKTQKASSKPYLKTKQASLGYVQTNLHTTKSQMNLEIKTQGEHG